MNLGNLKNLHTNSHRATDWESWEIVAALRSKGTSLAAVCRAAGYSNKGTLWNALARKWPKGERIIADAIGVEPAVIWPSRYPHPNKSEKLTQSNTSVCDNTQVQGAA